MGSPVTALQSAGFSDDEVAAWTSERRTILETAGFQSNEIDAYFAGSVVAPEKIPQAVEDRIEAGNEARKREGGLMQTIPQGVAMMSTADGRGRLWEAVKKYPSHFITSMMETLAVPGEAAAGKLDLSTDEGLDKAIGLGTLVGFGRLGKLPQTGKTSGLSVAMGEQVARVERSPIGEIYELPIGGLPVAEDFANAAKTTAGPDGPMPVQEKLLRLYEEQGRHPSEVAHDASTDPIVAQRLLSKDPQDMPYAKAPARDSAETAGGGGEEPPAGGPPKESVAPEPGSYAEAQQKILDRLSIGEREPKRPWTFDRLYTEAIDDLHPIKAISTDAYEMARLTRGQFGKAEYFLEQGTFDFASFRTNGKPLREILEPVRDDLDGLRVYLAAKRAQEIEASGRKSGMDLEAVEKVTAEGKQYEGVAKDLVAYQNRLLSYLKDSGVLSDKAFDAMVEANKNYVPFYRLIDGEAGGPAGAGSSFGPANPVKRLTGSERKVIDPVESIIKNTYAYVSIAERNAVGIEIIDALKKQGFDVKTRRAAAGKSEGELVDYLKEQGVTDPEKLVDFIKNAGPDTGDTLGAFRNGVREEVKVNDPELVAAFRGIDRQTAGLLTKIFSVPAKTLRAGAVLTPDFMARNLIRDFLTAFINTGRGVFTPIDTLKGLAAVARRDADYQAWVKAGGANSTFVALDRHYLQESLTKLSADTGLMERSWNVITSPLRGLRMVSELIENATRVGEFKKLVGTDATKTELQSAAYASREVTLDFARMGAKMRSYNMLTAFANAQIQGVDRMVRAFHDRPVNTTTKIAAGVTLPSVLLWWANHDDPRYQELPHWQKDLFWIIPTDKWQPISAIDAREKPEHLIRQRGDGWEYNNGSIWRIPKPFEVGVIFGSGVERALDQLAGNKEAFDSFTKSVVQALTPNFIPTAAQPVFEQWANRSTFTDRTLIPADMEKHLPEYQYTPYTTELSKKLGQMFSAFPGVRTAATEEGNVAGPIARALTTPILIENYIRSWTGGLGMYALEAADASLRKTGNLPDPVKPTPTLADIPFIKAFAVRYPSANAQSIQDFYDDHQKNKRFFDTWMARAQEGDIKAMERIQEAGGMGMFVRLDAMKETLSGHSKLIRDIYKNPVIPAGEKRQLIDSLYYNMIQIGRAGRDLIREMGAGETPK